jgi:hypothetical protein
VITLFSFNFDIVHVSQVLLSISSFLVEPNADISMSPEIALLYRTNRAVHDQVLVLISGQPTFLKIILKLVASINNSFAINIVCISLLSLPNFRSFCFQVSLMSRIYFADCR